MFTMCVFMDNEPLSSRTFQNFSLITNPKCCTKSECIMFWKIALHFYTSLHDYQSAEGKHANDSPLQ